MVLISTIRVILRKYHSIRQRSDDIFARCFEGLESGKHPWIWSSGLAHHFPEEVFAVDLGDGWGLFGEGGVLLGSGGVKFFPWGLLAWS